ncbi:hypothetical protein ATE67_09730 [Sphingopyxis sp. H050]|nr:hypothetical protein ATE67_09730 [Sphingopyxis sp. H050]
MSIMQPEASAFIMEQSQLATVGASLTQTRTREGRFDLLGPGAGRDCHSQWPGPRVCADAAETEVKAARAAAIKSRVFMSKILG